MSDRGLLHPTRYESPLVPQASIQSSDVQPVAPRSFIPRLLLRAFVAREPLASVATSLRATCYTERERLVEDAAGGRSYRESLSSILDRRRSIRESRSSLSDSMK